MEFPAPVSTHDRSIAQLERDANWYGHEGDETDRRVQHVAPHVPSKLLMPHDEPRQPDTEVLAHSHASRKNWRVGDLIHIPRMGAYRFAGNRGYGPKRALVFTSDGEVYVTRMISNRARKVT